MNDRKESDIGDAALRDEFRRLRTEVEADRVPDFNAMMARAKEEVAARPALEVVAGGGGDSSSTGIGVRDDERTRRRIVRIGGWVSLATAAAAAGILLIGTPGTSEADAEFERLIVAYSTDAAAGAWRSPTANLLRTPGVDLGAVPSVGSALPTTPRSPAAVSDRPQGRGL